MSDELMNRETMDRIVSSIVETYDDDRGINHLEGLPIPDREAILEAVDDLRAVIFPGFTDARPISHASVNYTIGELVGSAYATFSAEIETAFHYQCTVEKCGKCDCSAMARSAAIRLLEALPEIREKLKTDVAAAFAGDPAAESYDEIVLAYPGIRAIAMHRIAHELYRCKVPLIPRIIAEHAHSLTGIDIHPGATIGRYFFIDHGTGVVIGETTEIGENVKIYMGVTLGALAPGKGQALRGTKRHPTIEDDVTIYAGATILGGETTIGEGSTVGGNVWITESVPAYTLVASSKADLVFQGKKRLTAEERSARRPREWICPARALCPSGEDADCNGKCLAAARKMLEGDLGDAPEKKGRPAASTTAKKRAPKRKRTKAKAKKAKRPKPSRS